MFSPCIIYKNIGRKLNLDTRAGGRDAPHHVASSPRLRGRCVQGGSEECAAPAYERHAHRFNILYRGKTPEHHSCIHRNTTPCKPDPRFGAKLGPNFCADANTKRSCETTKRKKAKLRGRVAKVRPQRPHRRRPPPPRYIKFDRVLCFNAEVPDRLRQGARPLH